MKNFGANAFLFSILAALLMLPISFLKLTKVDQSEVLGEKAANIEYLNQTISTQEQRIKDLENKIKDYETKETTTSQKSNISTDLLAE